MTPLYFQFLQLVAGFIVQAVKIDSNKDGEISANEIWTFVNASILPIILNANGVKGQFQAFVEYVKNIGVSGVKTALMDILQYQLLPAELEEAERKIDAIVSGIVKTIEGIEETIKGFQDAFGGKVLQVKLVKRKAA